MRNTKSVARAMALAVAAIGINAVIPTPPTTKEIQTIDVSSLANCADVTYVAGITPEYTGHVSISSLPVTLVTASADEEKLSENTGKSVIPVAGMSDVLRNITETEKPKEVLSATVEDLDVATKFVPEGSIIEGYTNLGVSNVTSYLNIRKEAGTDNKIVGKMPGGSACEILEEKDGWYKIKSGDVTGYVCAEYILTGYDANIKAMETMVPELIVTGDVLNVREEPSTECLVSTQVSQGEHLEIVEDVTNGWYKVNINNLVGYVSADYVKVANTLPVAVEIVEVQATTQTAQTPQSSQSQSAPQVNFDTSNLDQTVSQTAVDIINYAMQFLGNPYVYGGNSLTNGTDCSGFCKLIFAEFGYSLPRCSADYVNAGTVIPYTSAKPGDILVYKYGSRIGHVAIYIGNGQIVHASTPSGGIRIGSAYFVTPYCAVRVLP